MAELCVCGSGKAMKQCCLRFLSGDQLARTPEQLMRSRFSAYFLGNHGQYLLQTWFPATAKGLSVASLSQRSCDWTRLEVLDKSQQGDQGFVEFNAWFNNDSGSEEALHEKSVFQRVAGHWLYIGGEVSSSPG